MARTFQPPHPIPWPTCPLINPALWLEVLLCAQVVVPIAGFAALPQPTSSPIADGHALVAAALTLGQVGLLAAACCVWRRNTQRNTRVVPGEVTTAEVSPPSSHLSPPQQRPSDDEGNTEDVTYTDQSHLKSSNSRPSGNPGEDGDVQYTRVVPSQRRGPEAAAVDGALTMQHSIITDDGLYEEVSPIGASDREVK
eukprot:CAMPEP_0182925894 /NCGR_PEP_ID=MMETSP0105_2-20130417/10720_1 /TAXON_ID=81532 ORGANISM="Acanthoeca-like sp., Strain 10tr" /NCGR_SAMPLE_ID=MMETSP0105_2 /ASSEMBLY_ACC=CAM_ASM_000205 /LENGTH=195 /DNA_ID=CAMNT_0025063765 /DNA_START=325 /DNA_END=912 /DNA_ORIENTATION=-